MLPIVGAAAGLLMLGGLWTPVVGLLGRHCGGVDRFHPAWNAIVSDHVGRSGHQPGDDRTGHLVDRCGRAMEESRFFHRRLEALPAPLRGRLTRALGLAIAEFDVSALDPDGRGMGAVIGSQLRQDVRDVVLDGFLRNRKLSGDLSIAIAHSNQPQHVDLAGAQFDIGGVVGQFGGNLRRDPFLPAMHGTNDLQGSMFTRPFNR